MFHHNTIIFNGALHIVKLIDVIFLSSPLRQIKATVLCKSTEFSILMLKEMSIILAENDLVIFCQQIIRFFYGFFFVRI